MDRQYIMPDYLEAADIKRIRKTLNMTQKELAVFIGCSKPTVERWEMSVDKITGPVVRLLYLLERRPEYVEELTVPPRQMPIRMWYMYRSTRCTLIDVDERKRRVSIINYTDNVQFRAFGTNTAPTFEDYEDFLKSRCFPETRDKMKLILADLNLPFYDPFLIIRKTQGKMSEDDFWINIEEMQ